MRQPSILSVTVNNGRQDGQSASEARRAQAEDRHGTDGAARQAAYERRKQDRATTDGDCARPAGAEGRCDPPVPGQTDVGGDARQPDPNRQFRKDVET